MKLTELDWQQAPDFGRREGILATLRLLDEIHPGPVTIVETGTLRDPDSRDGDGWNTLAWGWFCSVKGGTVYTVDNDPQVLTVCQKLTEPYADHIRYVKASSVEFLQHWNGSKGPIQLLYQNSLDELGNRTVSERHNLAEACSALPHLAETALILIDDTHPVSIQEPHPEHLYGKGAQTVPFLQKHGFETQWIAHGQVLLQHGNRPAITGKPHAPLLACSPITGCILARNEDRNLEAAISTLRQFCSRVIVIDNSSTDGTREIALRLADQVIDAPQVQSNFDRLRNLAIPHLTSEWVFFLDADERISPIVAARILDWTLNHSMGFDALIVPFKNYFCGKWMENGMWWPGYMRPQLLRVGKFSYNERLHAGCEIEGQKAYFPPEGDWGIDHYSYEDLCQYIQKLNAYTTGEAESMLKDGATHSWQAQLAHFVKDWQAYYDRGQAFGDGMQGFILSFMSGFYRFAARAKLWDLRRQSDCVGTGDPLPGSVREMLQFMQHVLQHGPEPWTSERHAGLQSLAPSPGTPPITQGKPVVPLLLRGPIFSKSGFGDELRQFALAMLEADLEFGLVVEDWGDEDPGLAATVRECLEARIVPADSPAVIAITHTLACALRRLPDVTFQIARTMFETDRLPESVAENLNRMDRIWVPSEFNRDTFIRSGVDPDRIAIIPGCLDPAPFAARDLTPLPLTERVEGWELEGEGPFTFLSVFDWTSHKGWDVLLEAFVRECEDPASPLSLSSTRLLLKVWSTNGYSLADMKAQAETLLQEKCGKGLAAFPNIYFWNETLPAPELPRLYRAVHAFVLPTRGEGWCRPLMEAMAAGLPAIATAWSGLTAFHDESVGYPLKFQMTPVPDAGAREIPPYAGHCWAEPDSEDLQRLMRRLVTRKAEAAKKGKAAAKRIEASFTRSAAGKLLISELTECREKAQHAMPAAHANAAPVQIRRSPANSPTLRPQSLGELHFPVGRLLCRETPPAVDFIKELGRPLRVLWVGDQDFLSSLALVNREICLGLLQCPDIELSLKWEDRPFPKLTAKDDPRFEALFQLRNRPLTGQPDITIRHHFPPNWLRPDVGKLVVMQPWEYAHLPIDWVQGALLADEVWAYSRFVRDVYVRSGVPAERLRVMPLGFNPAVFTPEGPVFPLQTTKRTRFLFVGGALDRKGADLLLDVYLRNFKRSDDVCLIVKDFGTKTYYAEQTFGEAFRRAAADPSAPEIHYEDRDLTESELASLYRAATALVHPYRGEGFALPPLEAAALGIPSIVTAGGPTDDYLDDASAYRLPYRRRLSGCSQVGPFPCAGDPWQLDPDPESLIRAMMSAYTHPEDARSRGAKAYQRLAAHWSWGSTVAEVRRRLLEMVCPTPPAKQIPAVPWQKTNGNGA